MDQFEAWSAGSYSTGCSGFDLFSDASSSILEDGILDTSTAQSSLEAPDCSSDPSSAIFSANPYQVLYDESARFDDELTIPNRISVNSYTRNNNPYHRLEPAGPVISPHLGWNHDEARMPTPQPPNDQIVGESRFGLPSGGYHSSEEELFGSLSNGVDSTLLAYESPIRYVSPQINEHQPATFEQVWFSTESSGVQATPSLPNHLQARSPRHQTSIKASDGGVRKKNSRFAIPTGRTLDTIDQLISEAPTEKDIKELKQQKRLLRNRQAALDSRQRKKAHTECLEESERHLKDEIASLTNQLRQFQMRDTVNRQTQLHLKAEIDRQRGIAEMEKQEIRLDFNGRIEALRKSNRSLEADVQRLQSRPGSIKSDPKHVHESMSRPASHGSPFQLARRSSKVYEDYHSPAVAAQSPAASGMLLMLLMCGAYAASRSQPSAPTPISQVTEEVRVTSMRVLGDLFSSAGVGRYPPLAPTSTSMLTTSPTIPTAVIPIHPVPQSSMVQLPGWAKDHQLSASLIHYEHKETAPYGLSAGQYNDLTALEFDHQPERARSPRRIELEGLYAASRIHQPDSTAMRYARALRHDMLSDEEIRFFAHFVHKVEEQDKAHVSLVQAELPLFG